MYTIETCYCKFNLVPFEDKNRNLLQPKLYNNGDKHTNRYLRLLIFQGVKRITIYTKNYENRKGWYYRLHLLFSGKYAKNFILKN